MNESKLKPQERIYFTVFLDTFEELFKCNVDNFGNIITDSNKHLAIFVSKYSTRHNNYQCKQQQCSSRHPYRRFLTTTWRVLIINLRYLRYLY